MSFKPTVYVKQGCPFSFKFLLFITEAGLLNTIQIEEVIEGETRIDEVRQLLQDKLGAAAFPAVEIEDGKFMKETDDLIQYFADQHGKSVEDLTLVPFYSRGIFKKLGMLYVENKQYKERYGEL